ALDTAYANVFTVKHEAEANTSARMGTLDLAGSQLEDGSIALTWQQYNAEGTQAYLLERSLDGTSFESVTVVAAGNESQYGYQENVRFTGRIFYRVRVQRTDGTEVYSRVATIQDAGFFSGLHVEVYPNPIQGNRVHFTWDSQDEDAPLILHVRDLRGTLVHVETLDAFSRGQQQSLTLPEHLDPGLYLLQAEQGSHTQTIKVMKP
ncbi:MAG TPA: hypothetical protein DCE41_34290, partial [Cytophagales bacterium]|nr:hypothetical protein [Cytophagales bacterium]